MSKRLLSFVLAIACIGGTACGGRSAAPKLDANTAVAQPIALTPPVAAVPVFAIKLARSTPKGTVARLGRIDHVAVATGLRVRKMEVRSSGGRARLRVAAVDPLDFRPLALPAARDADFVWTALLAGQAVLSYDAAHELGISGGEPLRLGASGPAPSVGAFADTGVPNIADVLVSEQVGSRGGLRRVNVVEIGAEPGASIDPIARAVHRVVPGVTLHRLIARPPAVLQPNDPQPFGVAQGSVIGTMHYLIRKNGFIRPDPAWVSAYIVNASVPILGSVTCNRLMIPQLAAALAEIERDGLASLIDPADYGGCYVPRFIDRDPSLPLSMHAFGLAVDLNVSQNPLGSSGQMDQRVISIFEKWGFRWGGTFSRPDPMHFEVSRLVRP